MYRINEFLTPEERFGMMKIGAMRELASMGIGPGDLVHQVKQAADGDSRSGFGNFIATLQDVFKVSLMLGIPIGAVSYALKSALAPNKKKNRRLKEELDQYNDFVENYKRQMSGSGLLGTQGYRGYP